MHHQRGGDASGKTSAQGQGTVFYEEYAHLAMLFSICSIYVGVYNGVCLLGLEYLTRNGALRKEYVAAATSGSIHMLTLLLS